MAKQSFQHFLLCPVLAFSSFREWTRWLLRAEPTVAGPWRPHFPPALGKFARVAVELSEAISKAVFRITRLRAIRTQITTLPIGSIIVVPFWGSYLQPYNTIRYSQKGTTMEPMGCY